MHCMEEELTDTRKNSDDTVEDMRCDSHHQIFEMKNKVYAIFEKSEYARRDSRRQEAYILAQEKYKVADVRQLAFKQMDEKMEDTE